MKPHELGARELARRLAQRELSALEVVEDCLAQIEARDAELHAWAAVDAEFARRQARELDAGAVRGALHGVPLGVKDIFDTADLPTEFATMVPARAVHPHDPRRTPGGSSSGSAAAVAARMVPLAYGTQTVGSIIRPAAYCGIVGYKPSYGLLSRSGMKMGAESLDTAGVIARDVADAALLVSASAMRPDLAEVKTLEKPRLGVCRSPNWHHMAAEGAAAFEDAVKRIAERGARMVEKEISFQELDTAAGIILVYEMARGLAHEVLHHRGRVHPMLLERVDAGRALTYSEYSKALAYAADCRRRLKEYFADIDAILTPSATGEAPLGLGSTGNTAMNRLWTLLHGPCVTVPSGEGPTGMPLGIQLVGLPGDDARTLAVAQWTERALSSS